MLQCSKYVHHELFKRRRGQHRPLLIKPCHKDGIEYKGQPSELFGEFLHEIILIFLRL